MTRVMYADDTALTRVPAGSSQTFIESSLELNITKTKSCAEQKWLAGGEEAELQIPLD